jgi:hypothetical protein
MWPFRQYNSEVNRERNGIIESDTHASERAARAETFVDASLMEEKSKSGFVARLYGR